MMKWSFDLSLPLQDWMEVVVYPGFRPGMPDIWLGRLPQDLADASGQRYKSWIIENHKESAILEKALSEPLPVVDGWKLDFISGPDRAVRKKGKGPGQPADFLIASYSPPREGWPYFLLTWTNMHDPDLERGCYAWEVHDTVEESEAHGVALCKAIGVTPLILTQGSVSTS